MRKRSAPKKPASKDWHPADIKARLEKSGWSLRQLSIHHGLHEQSLKNALHRSWPRAERLIADAIGVQPTTIWPSRYTADGQPKPGQHTKRAKAARVSQVSAA